MQQAIMTEHHGTRHTTALVFWIIAAIIAVIAFGDTLTLFAVALTIVATGRWIYHQVEHRLAKNDAAIAPVTHLRPALTGRRDLKKISAHTSSRGSTAA